MMRCSAIAVCSSFFAAMAMAQDLMMFPVETFGDVVLPSTQSTLSDVQFEGAIGNYNNEFVISYGQSSVFAKSGRAVGRLDILTDKGHAPCTAFLIDGNRLVTNHHCVPGILDNENLEASVIVAVNFVAGYLEDGVVDSTTTYNVSPLPLETNEALDYTVLQVIGDANAEFGALKLASVLPDDRAPFWVIGHPMGEAQRISREKCQASVPAVSNDRLRHTCDTLPGNSGSPVIDPDTKTVVGLHHAGSRVGSTNFAIPMATILNASSILEAAQPDKPVVTAPDTSELDAALALAEALAHEDLNQRVTALEAMIARHPNTKAISRAKVLLAAARNAAAASKPEAPVKPVEATTERDIIAEMALNDDVQNCDKFAGHQLHHDFARGAMREVGTPFGEVDPAKAISACQAALDAFPDHPRMLTFLGRAFHAKKDFKRAFDAYQRAVNEGDPFAANNLGGMYEAGLGVTKSLDEAFKLYTISSEAGFAVAQNNLGIFYRDGRTGPKSAANAAKWFRASAEQGYEWGQYHLALLYEDGQGVSQSFDESHKWFLLAANQGHGAAQNYIGTHFQNGTGTRQSDAEAIKWYRAAAEQGNQWGQSNLGWMYENGRGVPQSFEQAFEYYLLSANQGNSVSQNNLGLLYQHGRGVAQSDAEAAKWYRASAEGGYHWGQHNIASFHVEGRGVPQSYGEAYRWFLESANQENSSAKNNLGLLYQNGQGVKQSDAEAIKWYRAAAELNDPWGQHNMGWMALEGRGMTKSPEEAVKWFELSAAQGNSSAQNNLGLIFEYGRAGTKDPDLAADLYVQALRGGDTWSVESRTTWDATTARALQRRLRDLGVYTGGIDGQIGPGTRAAMRKLLPE